jgi:hypothetical protein
MEGADAFAFLVGQQHGNAIGHSHRKRHLAQVRDDAIAYEWLVRKRRHMMDHRRVYLPGQHQRHCVAALDRVDRAQEDAAVLVDIFARILLGDAQVQRPAAIGLRYPASSGAEPMQHERQLLKVFGLNDLRPRRTHAHRLDSGRGLDHVSIVTTAAGISSDCRRRRASDTLVRCHVR